jgi:arginine decarboxylase
MALRDAKIASFNLVGVSSIFPPRCRIIPLKKGLKMTKAGQILHAVYSRNETNEPNRLIGASVGLAIPKDPSMYGYLSEHHCFGQTNDIAGDYAEDIAAEMLATILGVQFNMDSSWDEKRQQWKISGEIVDLPTLLRLLSAIKTDYGLINCGCGIITMCSFRRDNINTSFERRRWSSTTTN